MLHLVISVKGVVNFSKWTWDRNSNLCKGIREINVCHTPPLPPPDSNDQVSTSEAKSRALTVDQLPTPGRPGAWFACLVSWGWDRPHAVNWPCFHRPHWGFKALLLCGRWVCVSQDARENQAPTFLRQMLKARGTFWPKEEKLWFQDHAVVSCSVQKFAS